MQKKRADILLFEKGLVKSRAESQILIMSGKVKANNIKINKPSLLISSDSLLEIDTDKRYVSRGAYKLLKALDVFMIDVEDKVCADIGSSTGGFTEILLIKGAKKVYCIDVGKGQLDYKLRKDNRVMVLEETNARFLDKKMFQENLDIVTIDVSFISTDLIVPPLKPILRDNAEIIILLKPQFEVGRGKVGKGGIVKNKEYINEMIIIKRNFFINCGFIPTGLTYSPVKGAKGNREYLLNLSLKNDKICITENLIREVINESWDIL